MRRVRRLLVLENGWPFMLKRKYLAELLLVIISVIIPILSTNIGELSSCSRSLLRNTRPQSPRPTFPFHKPSCPPPLQIPIGRIITREIYARRVVQKFLLEAVGGDDQVVLGRTQVFNQGEGAVGVTGEEEMLEPAKTITGDAINLVGILTGLKPAWFIVNGNWSVGWRCNFHNWCGSCISISGANLEE